jgi:DNA-binding response OmpR family regulator
MEHTHVVVTTDNEPVARQLARALACDQCNVQIRTTPKECAELVESGAVDVLVLDLLMSEGTGFSLFLACRESLTALPIVTFTKPTDGKAKVTLRKMDPRSMWPSTPVSPHIIHERVADCLANGAAAS